MGFIGGCCGGLAVAIFAGLAVYLLMFAIDEAAQRTTFQTSYDDCSQIKYASILPATSVSVSGGGQIAFFSGFSFARAMYRTCNMPRVTHFGGNSGSGWFLANFMYSDRLGRGFKDMTMPLADLTRSYAEKYERMLQRTVEIDVGAVDDESMLKLFKVVRAIVALAARGFRLASADSTTCDDVKAKVDDLLMSVGALLAGNSDWITYVKDILTVDIPNADELLVGTTELNEPNITYLYQMTLPPTAWGSGEAENELDYETKHVCAHWMPTQMQLGLGASNKTYMPLSFMHGGRRAAKTSSWLFGGVDGEYWFRGLKRRKKGMYPCPGSNPLVKRVKPCTARDVEEQALRCLESSYPDDSSLVTGAFALFHESGQNGQIANLPGVAGGSVLVSGVAAGTSSALGVVAVPTILGGLFPWGLYPENAQDSFGLRRFMRCLPSKLEHFASPITDVSRISHSSGKVSHLELEEGGYRLLDGVYVDNTAATHVVSSSQMACEDTQSKVICEPFLTLIVIDSLDYTMYRGVAPGLGTMFERYDDYGNKDWSLTDNGFGDQAEILRAPPGWALGIDLIGMAPNRRTFAGEMPMKDTWFQALWTRHMQITTSTVSNLWYGVRPDTDACLLLVECLWLRPVLVTGIGPNLVARRIEQWFGDSSDATSDEMTDVFRRFFNAIDISNPQFDPKFQFDRCRRRRG